MSNETTYSPTVAALRAASLTIVATCAGLTPGVRSANTYAYCLLLTPGTTLTSFSYYVIMTALLSVSLLSTVGFDSLTVVLSVSEVEVPFSPCLRVLKRCILGLQLGSPVMMRLR